MSAHVLLNLFNELGKRDKMRGLSCIACILSLFRMNVRFYLSYENKTTLKLHCCFFCIKTPRFCHIYATLLR